MSVKDTGPGIPEEEIPVVLASFGQGSNSIKSAEQGAGLGLPIAKNLIDLHGGTFTLKSKLRIGTEVDRDLPAGTGDVGAGADLRRRGGADPAARGHVLVVALVFIRRRDGPRTPGACPAPSGARDTPCSTITGDKG